MPTFESAIVTEAKRVARLSRRASALRKQLKETEAELRFAKRMLKKIAGAARDPFESDTPHADTRRMRMQTPTIHLNGTSAKQLRADYKAAMVALQAATDALQLTAPNGRDYYVKSDVNALRQATFEHNQRWEKLQGVLAELEQLYLACVPASTDPELPATDTESERY